jgi:outer membrane protein assembly factor BamE (lipoprotein component of BamABCDE complex)
MPSPLERCRLVFSFTFLVLLTGCVVPVFQEAPFKDDVIEPLKVGKSTRADVLMAVGEPRFVSVDERYFAYTAGQLHAVLIVGGAYSAQAVPIATTHFLVVEFAPNGTISKLDSVTGSLKGHCAVQRTCLTADGSPDLRGQKAKIKPERKHRRR